MNNCKNCLLRHFNSTYLKLSLLNSRNNDIQLISFLFKATVDLNVIIVKVIKFFKCENLDCVKNKALNIAQNK